MRCESLAWLLLLLLTRNRSSEATATTKPRDIGESGPSLDTNILIDPSNNNFVDGLNRERFFRGLNAVYKKHPYHPSTSATWDARETMNAQDARQIADWGFNVVRLGVLWAGLEPVQGTYNHTYLDEIETIVDTLSEEGIFTIIDMHQDLLSRRFCGNGIPDWAAKLAAQGSLTFPLPSHLPMVLDKSGWPRMQDCLENDFVTYYFSSSVSRAFESLYGNRFGLLDSFKKFWMLTADRFKGKDHVLGYEIINEPWAGNIYK